jgi:HEAT repeat protein
MSMNIHKVEELITRIRQTSAAGTAAGWEGAGPYGAPAIEPLAKLLLDPNFETQRAAKKALYQVIYFAGNPVTKQESKQVEQAVIGLLSHPSAKVRREALWLLSELGTRASVQPVAKLLSDPEAREDARCALLRLPYRRSVSALKSAFKTAPEEFKHALADALRLKGEKVEGYPSRKKVPVAATEVKPFQKA